MPTQLLEPGTPVEGYFLQDKIGEGASGSAFAGLSPKNDDVVIKFIPLTNSWFTKEYKREVQALKRFKKVKPVVTLLDNFSYGTYGVIVMERMKMDLLDYIELGPICVDDVQRIFFQVCTAIKAMHRTRTAHLDIKPENIFMNDVDEVKLGDFGSSFRWSRDSPEKFGVSGTTFYCAPEVKQKDSYKPAEADIWSLGILLHVLLTGFWPYSASSQEQLSERISMGQTKLLVNQLPDDPSLISLLQHMLQIDPRDRPTIGEILEHEFVTSGSSSESPRTAVPTLSLSGDDINSSNPGIPTSCSQPNLSDLLNNIEQDKPENSEPDVAEGEFILSPRRPKLSEKPQLRSRKKKPAHNQQRRTSWTTKHFLGRISKLVK